MNPNERIAYSVCEVADKLGCSTDTIRRLIRSNLLKAFRMGSKRADLRIEQEALEKFIANGGIPRRGL